MTIGTLPKTGYHFQDSQLSGCAQSARYHGSHLSSGSPVTAGALRVLGVCVMAEQWTTTRKRIMRRDGRKCQAACDHTDLLTVHHIIPRREGGQSNDENLTTLCALCHDEIENTDIRTLSGIHAYAPKWHACVTWYQTKRRPLRPTPRKRKVNLKLQPAEVKPSESPLPVHYCLYCGDVFTRLRHYWNFCGYCSLQCICDTGPENATKVEERYFKAKSESRKMYDAL